MNRGIGLGIFVIVFVFLAYVNVWVLIISGLLVVIAGVFSGGNISMARRNYEAKEPGMSEEVHRIKMREMRRSEQTMGVMLSVLGVAVIAVGLILIILGWHGVLTL